MLVSSPEQRVRPLGHGIGYNNGVPNHGGSEHHASGGVSSSEKGGIMATMVLTWGIEYHKTMVAAEKARRDVTMPKGWRVAAELFLWYPFHKVTTKSAGLVSLLEKFETLPSTVLLQEETKTIPQELNELFKTMCFVLQQTEAIGLSDGIVLKKYMGRLGAISQQINTFAVRFEDAQRKLLSRIPAEEVPAYRDSFEAYWGSNLKSSEATDDDVKVGQLHF